MLLTAVTKLLNLVVIISVCNGRFPMSSDRRMLDALIVQLESALAYAKAIRDSGKHRGLNKTNAQYATASQSTDFAKVIQDAATTLSSHVEYWGAGSNRE